VRLGRDYTPGFWNVTVFDPYTLNGSGASEVFNGTTGFIPAAQVTGVRASNSIGYFLPGYLGGFYGQVQYYMGENASNATNKRDGSGGGLRLGYSNSKMNVAFGSITTHYVSGDFKQSNIGASYDFGFARFMALVARDKLETAIGISGRGFLVGGFVPVGGSHEIRWSYSGYKAVNGSGRGTAPESKKLAVGYVHNFSKRTSVYATYATLRNRGAANIAIGGATTDANQKSSGLDVGMRHNF
jgi:predicted porin